jgi:hypothetical protein
MRRVSIHTLCFAVTLAIGVAVSWFLIFLQSDGSEIPAVVFIEDGTVVAPCALPKSLTFPIREVDFANLTYPSQFLGAAGGFNMRNGEVPPQRKDELGRPLDIWLVLGSVTYGDVTGDGLEEAIVELGWLTGGTASPGLVYIYGLKKGKPNLLWAFETGDRADGGLKNVFAENGQLVVELKGKDKIPGWNLYEDDGTNHGACCPTYFTRTRYEWVSNRFRQKEQSEVLPLSTRHQ